MKLGQPDIRYFIIHTDTDIYTFHPFTQKGSSGGILSPLCRKKKLKKGFFLARSQTDTYHVTLLFYLVYF